jgi:hypothetical protein
MVVARTRGSVLREADPSCPSKRGQDGEHVVSIGYLGRKVGHHRSNNQSSTNQSVSNGEARQRGFE